MRRELIHSHKHALFDRATDVAGSEAFYQNAFRR